MPASDQVYQTSISINGKIDESITKGLQKIDVDTGKIVKQSKALGQESKKAFEMMGKGLAVATAKTKDFTNSLKELMLPLLGITVAFKGFQTIGDTIQAAIDKFKGAKEAAAAFKATIQSIVGIGRESAIEKTMVEQQDFLKKHFEGIYGAGLFRKIQEQLVQSGIALGDKAMIGLVNAVGFIHQTMRISGDQAAELADKIAKVMIMPRVDPELKKMLRTFGITDVAKIAKLSPTARLAAVVAALKRQTFVEQQLHDARMKDTKELMQAQTEGSGLMVQIGKFWEELQIKGDKVSEHLKNAFLEAFVPASAEINKLLEGPMANLDKAVKAIGEEFRKILNPSKTDIDKGYKTGDIFGNLAKAWKEEILPEMRKDWENFTKWVTEQWSTLGKSDNPMLKALHDGTDKLLAAVSQIAIALGEFAKVNWELMQEAAKNIGDAAKLLVNAANALHPTVLPKNPTEAAQWEKEAGEYERRLREKETGMPHFASGGIVATPQVGLIGEAGRESIIPLRRDANTLGIMQATFDALGIKPGDADSWGQELFAVPGMGGVGGIGGGVGGFGTVGAGGPIRAEAYGPSQGEYTHDTLFGPTGAHLVHGDYAVSPDLSAGHGLGQSFQFSDAGGNLHTGRYADASYRTSGHPNTRTIEEWDGRDLGTVSNLTWLAQGGIVSKKMLSWLGEAGREAVIPLEGARGKRALQGLGGPSAGHTFHFSPNISVSGIATNEVVDNLVEQLRTNFGRWLEDSHFEHSRSAFT